MTQSGHAHEDRIRPSYIAPMRHFDLNDADGPLIHCDLEYVPVCFGPDDRGA